MQTSGLLLAVVAAMVASTSAITEPATKISFPDTCKLPGMGLLPQSVAGTGCRVKKIGPVAVKVYAVAMYVDKLSMMKKLLNFRDVKATDSTLIAGVKSDFDKTLVLKMARTVGSDKMASALADSVKPRMKGDLDSLAKFQELLAEGMKDQAGGEAAKGTQFAFAMKGRSMCVSVNGKSTGSLQSSSLCNAMLDTYLDDNAVSADAKTSILEGICKMIS